MTAVSAVSLRARAELWAWRHGLVGPLVLALLAAAAALAWDAWGSTTRLRAGAAAPTVVAPPAPAPNAALDDTQRLAELRAVLLPAHEATAAVRRLVEITQPELAWQRAEFLQGEDAAPGVARLQITVPVSGEYRAMRRALQRALAEMPQLSLDQLQLRREQAGESQLDTRLRFSLWLRPAAKVQP